MAFKVGRLVVGTYRQRIKEKLHVRGHQDLVRGAIKWVEDWGG